MDNETTNLHALKNLAAEAAAQHEAYETSLSAETKAEAELLRTVVAVIKPALRALSSKIKTSYRCWWVGQTHTKDEAGYDETRGVFVGEESPGPSREWGRSDAAGSYSGTDLFLSEEGSWLEVTYEGHWSKWQGAGSEWSARLSPVTVEYVAENYDVDELITRLSDSLRKQLDGGKMKRAEAALKRAEKLEALKSLLG